MLTRFHYSTVYYIIPNNFQNILLWIFNLTFFTARVQFSGVKMSMYIIEIVGVLIVLEIIIIRICGVNKNVETEITKREIEEFDTKNEGFFLIIKTI